jgi:dihydrofolate reductase
MLTARRQFFTSFTIMITRESTTTDMIMGRGAYDTTGTPKPKPPPKKC